MSDKSTAETKAQWWQPYVRRSMPQSAVGYVALAVVAIYIATFAPEELGELTDSRVPLWLVHVVIATLVCVIVYIIINTLQRRWSRLQGQLQQTVTQFRALVEQVPAITYTKSLGLESRTLFISPQVEATLGFPRESWLNGRNFWRERLHPDDRERVTTEIDRATITSTPFSLEYRMVTRDGRVLWFSDSARPTYDETGKPLNYQGALFDITEMKHGEEGLSQLAAIVRSTDDAIISITPDGSIASWNAGAERMCGYSTLEAIGKPIRVIYPDGLSREELDRVNHAWDAQSAQHFETTRLRKDGRLVEVSLTISPVLDSHGRVIATTRNGMAQAFRAG